MTSLPHYDRQDKSSTISNVTVNYPLGIRTMYRLQTWKAESNWGIQGYQLPHKYLDPVQQAKDRELSEQLKKPQKIDRSKLPTKLSYLDMQIKQRASLPGPSTYNFNLTWAKANPSAHLKKSSPSKNTFIDQIFQRAKHEKLPAVGQYNIIKTEDQIKEQVKAMRQKPRAKSVIKQCYLGEYEYLANSTPGPGMYKVKMLLPPIHKNRTNPKEMIKKHSEIQQKEKQRIKQSGPDAWSYNPLDVSINTFDYQKKKFCFYILFVFTVYFLKASKEKSKAKSKFWGVEERFKDPKKTKSKIENILPGPGYFQNLLYTIQQGKYNLIVQWPGKPEKKHKN